MLKNFRLNIIARIVLITITLTGCIYLWSNTGFYVSAGLLTLLVVYQTIRLIHYVELTNRKLSRFLNSIRYSDFSRSFSGKKLGKSFEELDEIFANVVDAFKKQRIEKQIQYRYTQTVVQHIGIGLISFNHKGEVELINTAAKRLFDIPTLRNIKMLKKISSSLFEAVMELKAGNRTLVQISLNNKTLQLAISATEFRMRDEFYKLVSFQNIHMELEEKEMEAWQNLTQVLAHEIMNSITPIASLADTVHMLLNQQGVRQGEEYHINNEALDDVKEALKTINNRSHGLMRFVNSYRDFTQIPDPDLELFGVNELLQRIKNLNKGEAEAQNIVITVETNPESLEVNADPHLIEQVLINLTKNAFRALEETAEASIKLIGRLDKNGRAVIDVQDNGPGIKPENQHKVFIPFYSTSQPARRGGSGIGLSLSRQIMRQHGGQLSVNSQKGQGTIFTLRF